MNYDEMNAAELASLPVQAEQQSMSAPQPTLEPTICALSKWTNRNEPGRRPLL